MTKFLVDACAVLYLASEGVEASDAHQVLAPTLLRSQTLSALHEAVQRGDIQPDVARERLTRIEYLALTQLQADACVTLDAELARSVEGIVATPSIDALLGT